MKSIYEYKSYSSGELSFKDLDAKKGIVTGYFASFNNVDSDGDMFVKGTFNKSISENFARIKHLLNHDTTKTVGKILVLKEDEKGLYYESQIGTHTLGLDFTKMVESGIITEHSVGFKIIQQTKQKDYNEIKEVALWEGSSLTAWGANSNTPIVSMKGECLEDEIEMLIKRQKALSLFCKNSDASDELIQSLLLETKQLTQIILDLKSTQPAKVIEPNNDEKIIETIKQFTNNLKNN